jgi:hypothetical protein
LLSRGNGKSTIVKIGDGIGLGPEAETTCAKRVVTEVEHRTLVEEDLHLACSHRDVELMPPAYVYDVIATLNQVPYSFRHIINSDVLPHRVGAR